MQRFTSPTETVPENQKQDFAPFFCTWENIVSGAPTGEFKVRLGYIPWKFGFLVIVSYRQLVYFHLYLRDFTYTFEDSRLEHTAITHENKGKWPSKPLWLRTYGNEIIWTNPFTKYQQDITVGILSQLKPKYDLRFGVEQGHPKMNLWSNDIW